MPRKKEKYIIPKGTPFGGLPKKVEHLPEAEQVKRTLQDKQWERLSRDLGIHGFHFEWGFQEYIYPDLSQETIGKLWHVWNQANIQQGQLIAAKHSRDGFLKTLSERRKELELTEQPVLRQELEERIRALERLAKLPLPVVTPVTYAPADTFEDLFPRDALEINMNELPQDVIELCREYMQKVGEMDGRHTTAQDMETLDSERADLHNRLVVVLEEAGIKYEDRGKVTALAEKVTRWHGAL